MCMTNGNAQKSCMLQLLWQHPKLNILSVNQNENFCSSSKQCHTVPSHAMIPLSFLYIYSTTYFPSSFWLINNFHIRVTSTSNHFHRDCTQTMMIHLQIYWKVDLFNHTWARFGHTFNNNDKTESLKPVLFTIYALHFELRWYEVDAITQNMMLSILWYTSQQMSK